ncbi:MULTISPECIES: hypothetical protein [Corynebacterium]|uniref:hypothetical protein n=1 Tax=Corynebacterium TaxID=1716 RepID=UPI0008DA9F61|nr:MULTISPECIES: hypothetical protein [Corynebacterium]MCQ4608259.1 hypothetical protein [Corynebacterium pseudogenitalium]MDK8244022.1 hypothetical protein [Corynebacterium sp. UMB10321]
MTLSEITLTRTYFLAKEEDLPRCYQRYLERVERVKQFTTVYLVADVEFYEVNPIVKENLLHDLQAQSDEPVNEDEWNMYSYSTALGTIDEPIEPGAAVSRLWEDMLLTDDEEWPRSFISTVNFSSLMSRPK